MSGIKENLQTDSIEHFSVVRLTFQNYAEVDRDFVAKHYGQLKSMWRILNEEGGFHNLKFNPSLYFPTLTNGWTEVKEYHEIPDNAEVVFSYYGKNLFGICTLREVDDPNDLPKFHSRSLLPNETFVFDVDVNDRWLKSPTIVLPQRFGDFLKQYYHEMLACCNDQGYYANFQVYLRNDKKYTVELGNDWDIFCRTSIFQPGIIRFKFTTNNTHSMCHVYQLSTSASVSSALVSASNPLR